MWKNPKIWVFFSCTFRPKKVDFGQRLQKPPIFPQHCWTITDKIVIEKAIWSPILPHLTPLCWKKNRLSKILKQLLLILIEFLPKVTKLAKQRKLAKKSIPDNNGLLMANQVFMWKAPLECWNDQLGKAPSKNKRLLCQWY